MDTLHNDPSDLPVLRDHRRQWRQCRYVYPVVSRRGRGLSIGINLNPDKRCNFACMYCQIDRKTRREFHHVDLHVVRQELRLAIEAAMSGELWSEERFAATPAGLRRVNDLAFSGDGEPTLVADFDHVVQTAADVRQEFIQIARQGGPFAASVEELEAVKLVLITNASQLEQPHVQRALLTLDANNGEVWAKLDAGSDAYFQRVNHPYPRITLEHILRNIVAAARQRPIVIQSLFLRIEGVSTPADELEAYIANLQHILNGGGRIKLVQVHTIARPPSETSASAIGNEKLDAIAARIRAAVPAIPVETFYGATLT